MGTEVGLTGSDHRNVDTPPGVFAYAVSSAHGRH